MESEHPGAVLFERHHLVIFRYLWRMTGRRDVAEDLTQDVFVRAVRGLENYGTEESGSGMVVRNRAASAARSPANRRPSRCRGRTNRP